MTKVIQLWLLFWAVKQTLGIFPCSHTVQFVMLRYNKREIAIFDDVFIGLFCYRCYHYVWLRVISNKNSDENNCCSAYCLCHYTAIVHGNTFFDIELRSGAAAGISPRQYSVAASHYISVDDCSECIFCFSAIIVNYD